MDDEEDRFSNNSEDSGQDNENDHENEPDETMEDADDGDNDGEAEDENNDDEENDNENDEEDGDGEGDGDGDADGDGDGEPGGSRRTAAQSSRSVNGGDDGTGEKKSATTPLNSIPKAATWRPTIRPEALTAKLYDIVPTMAAPQATSVNAMAITPDLRYWITGGSDGYIRKYDGPGTVNGKLALTVAQKHPFVDSVTKAGILMSYWENDEPSPATGRADADHVLSPVYSLAVHSQALWLLSGLESGGINLQSVRHDEGKRIACLQQHTSAVSVLTMAPDERSVLSGGWDKNIFDWDLDTGHPKRSFDGSGGQISSIELRPAGGLPITTVIEEPLPSSTISTNNGAPITNGGGGYVAGTNGTVPDGPEKTNNFSGGEQAASPGNDSLFGGGSDAGSLFGETAGEQPFGQDDDDGGYGEGLHMMGGGHEGGMDHSADLAMAEIGSGEPEEKPDAAAAAEQPGDGGDTASAAVDAMQIDLAPEETTQQTTDSAEQGLSQTEPSTTQTDAGPSQSETWQPPKDTSPPPPPSESLQPAFADVAALKVEDQQQEDHEVELRRDHSPTLVTSPSSSSANHDPSQTSPTTFLSSAMDGTIRIWDRRAPNPVARMGTRVGVPPWCMSAVWSPDGNMIYAGRRNGTVEEFDIRHAARGWQPERTFKFPAGSGPVSALKPMANGKHLVCASHDILRLYDLQQPKALKHSTVPFLIIPGPPRGGVISSLYIDPTSRFMLSAAGTRGWEGTSTEVLIGYEIHISNDS